MSREIIVAENATLKKSLDRIEAWKKSELDRIAKMEKGWLEHQATFEERRKKETDAVEAQAEQKIQTVKDALKIKYDRVGAKLGNRRSTDVVQREVEERRQRNHQKYLDTTVYLRNAAFKPIAKDERAVFVEKAAVQDGEAAKNKVLEARKAKKEQDEATHLENLNAARQTTKPSSFNALFIRRATAADKAKAWGVDSFLNPSARKDVQNDFDFVQQASVKGTVPENLGSRDRKEVQDTRAKMAKTPVFYVAEQREREEPRLPAQFGSRERAGVKAVAERNKAGMPYKGQLGLFKFKKAPVENTRVLELDVDPVAPRMGS